MSLATYPESRVERNYSNIEREGLAIVYAVTRLRQFLLGRSFAIKKDHKPLEFIFNPNNELPKVASARLARWAITLMVYDFVIKHTPGKDIGHADAMSRLTLKNNDGEELVAQISQVIFEKNYNLTTFRRASSDA